MLSVHMDDDIYNANEAGLFFDLVPKRMLGFIGKSCTREKLLKDCGTVLFCANITRSDTRRLLVIGNPIDLGILKRTSTSLSDTSKTLRLG